MIDPPTSNKQEWITGDDGVSRNVLGIDANSAELEGQRAAIKLRDNPPILTPPDFAPNITVPDDMPLSIEQLAAMMNVTEAMIRKLVTKRAFPVEQSGSRGRIRVLAKHLGLVRKAISEPPAMMTRMTLAKKVEELDRRLFALEESLMLVSGG